MTKAELITMIQNAGFEAVERDTVYNRIEGHLVLSASPPYIYIQHRARRNLHNTTLRSAFKAKF